MILCFLFIGFLIPLGAYYRLRCLIAALPVLYIFFELRAWLNVRIMMLTALLGVVIYYRHKYVSLFIIAPFVVIIHVLT